MAREPKTQANAVFATSANPERRRVLDLLRARDRPAGELVAAFPRLPQPAVSRHLRVLREAGLVRVSPKAQQRVYSVQGSGFKRWNPGSRTTASSGRAVSSIFPPTLAVEQRRVPDAKGRIRPIGTVVVQGSKATLVFRRRLARPPEAVRRVLTDPSELSNWYMTKAMIEKKEGGAIDFIAGPSRLHVTGRILTWDPQRVFEYEWKVAPRPELQFGEDAVISWELSKDGEGTMLHLEHRRLNSHTAVGFALGTRSFLNRLEAQLGNRPLPNWQTRYSEVAPRHPPSWLSKSQGS